MGPKYLGPKNYLRFVFLTAAPRKGSGAVPVLPPPVTSTAIYKKDGRKLNGGIYTNKYRAEIAVIRSSLVQHDFKARHVVYFGTGITSNGASMAITKQDFYEGAALNLVARTGYIAGIISRAPFYILNGHVAVMLKYSTRGRSPWGFSVTENEQSQLKARALKSNTAIGLICGSDGVVALSYQSFTSIAAPRDGAIHISCYRDHGEHYEVSGPDGKLHKKISPSSWNKILDLKGNKL